MFIDITEDELVLLDGKVANPKVQEQINYLKAVRQQNQSVIGDNLTSAERNLISKLITSVNKLGMIEIRNDKRFSCEICNKKAKEILFKSGRNKGRFKEWQELHGKKICDVFACNECFQRLTPILVENLTLAKGFVSGLPGHINKWYKVGYRQCTGCQEITSTNEWKPKPCFMGSGYFPGQCPKCWQEVLIFGNYYKVINDRFDILPIDQVRKEYVSWLGYLI